MRRKVAWFVLALLGAMFWPVSVSAQAGALQLEASALYAGTSKYGEWLPVAVTLENSGNDLRGQIRVVVSGSGNAATYGQRVELARGARKELTIFVVPNNFSRRLRVQFVPDGSSAALVQQEVAITPVPNIRFMVATIGGEGDGLEPLSGINFRGEQNVRDKAVLVIQSLASLPDRPAALRTLDLIVISGVDSSVLTPQQKGALEQYVAFGGLLALSGGPEAGRVLAGIPESLRPVTLAGEASLAALPALEPLTGEAVRVVGPFPAARAEPVAGASVLVAQDGIPLAVERPVGEGAVFWLALDASGSPFDAWAGTDEFWQRLLGKRSFYPADMPPDVSPRQIANDQLFYALQNLPSLDLPSLQLLVPLLATYILFVGPVNYFVLRRRRRMELAWITIPVLTLLFSVGAYGLGVRLRGSDVIVNQISLVRAMDEGQSAYVRSLVGVFSPARRSYTLSVSGNSLLSPLQSSDPFGSGSESGTTGTLLQGEPSQVEAFTVNQWTMQGVMAETLVESSYGLSSDLSLTDGRLIGTVANRSNFAWEDVVVVLGQDFARLGEIAPGASKEVSMRFNEANPDFFGPDLSWRIFEDNFGPGGPNRSLEVRRQMLQSLFNPGFEPGIVGQQRQQPLLLAWISAPALEVSLGANSQPAQQATTLLYSDLAVRFGAGKVTIPRGLMGGQVIANDGGSCYGPGTLSLSPEFREAELSYQIPDELSTIEPTLLSLYIASDGGSFSAPDLALFHVERGEWEEIEESVLGRNRIQQPAAYINEAGLIRVRIQNPSPNRGGCLFLDAALEGTLN